jgi:hypothetical protein
MAKSYQCDILIVGGGVGGVAAALGATALGKTVILTEPTQWIGGQLTAQGVPPDENRFIEYHGCTRRYRFFRDGVRHYYKKYYPLTLEALRDPHFNPGLGEVSSLCHEPRVGLAVLEAMLASARSAERLKIYYGVEAVAAETSGDRVKKVSFRSMDGDETFDVEAKYVLDATELGDLLPLAGVEYVTGSESKCTTGEMHAHDGPAKPENSQALSWCFAMSHDPEVGADHVIDKPRSYELWRDYVPPTVPAWPGKLFSWDYPNVRCVSETQHSVLSPLSDHEAEGWTFRRILHTGHYLPVFAPRSVTLVNWVQIDYMAGSVIDQPAEIVAKRLEEARQQSLSFFYWMQTEAPRPDGCNGWPGLYLRSDILGTKDGLTMAPYHRESRRIQALFTVTENHVGTEARGGIDPDKLKSNPNKCAPDVRAEPFADSVGIGHYRIDLHPTACGDNYIDVSALPFQIPLGSLLPVRVRNLLPCCKNIGTTHVTNGCYRLHPVEWNIGESAGLLAAFCLHHGVEPVQVWKTPARLRDFQKLLVEQGVYLEWPDPKAS